MYVGHDRAGHRWRRRRADYTHIWGSGIAVDLNAVGEVPKTRMPYNAPADHITGFEFDVDSDPPRGPPSSRNTPTLLVEFPTVTQSEMAAYSYAVSKGHNTIIWSQLENPYDPTTGGPRSTVAPFDPAQLLSVRFHVIASAGGPIPYALCVNNLSAMTE